MFYFERLGGKQLASTKFLKHANFASHVTDYILAEIYIHWIILFIGYS